MSCEDYDEIGDLRGALLHGDTSGFIDAIVCPYDMQFGALTVGLMVYGIVMAGLYVRTGSIAVPAVMIIVGGTAVISRLPSGAVQIAVLALFLALSIGVLFLVNRAQTMT